MAISTNDITKTVSFHFEMFNTCIYLNHIYQLHVLKVQHICRAKNFKPKILNSLNLNSNKVMHHHVKLL